jgi:hypothetical protein
MELSKLDFQQARIKQVLFKSRLRSVLYGVREADDALFETAHNPLSQWLQTVVKPQFGAQTEVRQLERSIEQMLSAGRGLVRQYQRGQIEEARAGLEQVDTFAQDIESALQGLERAA